MRLGLLIFDTAGDPIAETAANALTETLREKDIDVVTNTPEPDALTGPARPPEVAPEPTAAIISNFKGAQEAGARLSRADCDGVIFWIGETANPAFLPPAVLPLTCPLLLVGQTHAALHEAARPLSDRSVFADKLVALGDGKNLAEPVNRWLHQNRRSERQKGTSAAHKLFNKRLVFAGEPRAFVDAAQWFHQFGVLVDDEAVEAETDDLVVTEGGDGCDTLAQFLLSEMSEKHDKEAGGDVNADKFDKTFTGPFAPTETENLPDTAAAFFQIFEQNSRFACLITPVAAVKSSPGRFDSYGSLYGLPGDARAKIRAACEALYIDVEEHGSWADFLTAASV